MAQANLKAVITAEDKASNVIGGVGASFGKLAGAMAVGQIAANALTSAIGVVTDAIKNNLGSAIKRVDTLNNSARTFDNMGFAADTVSESMKALEASIMGLPTPLDGAVRGMTALAATYGDVKLGQKVFTALNDAIIGFGGSADSVNNAVLQLSQLPMDGPLDAQTWMSLRNSGLTPVLVAMAKDMGMGVNEMKQKFGEGELKVKDFTDALVKMDEKGGGGLKNLQQIAKDATSGISTGWENMQTAITRGIASIIKAIGSQKISIAISNIGKYFEKSLKQIAIITPGVIEWLTKVTTNIINVAKQVAEYLSPKFAALGKTITEFMPTATRLWQEVLAPLAKVFGEVLVVAIGLLVDAINLLFTVLQPVITWMLDNKWVVLALAGAFTYLGVVMNFSNIVSAFTGAMDLVIGKLAATQTTASNLATFLTGTGAASFGIIAAAAVVAGILIVDAGNKAKAAWDNAQKSIDAASKSDDAVISRLRDLAKNGNAEQQARAKSQLQKLAATGAFASGGFTGRGMTNDIAGVVHKGEYVIPKSGVDQNTGMPKIKLNDRQPANINITVQAGAYMGNKQDARKYAQEIFKALQDVAQSNGMTVGQMIGQ